MTIALSKQPGSRLTRLSGRSGTDQTAGSDGLAHQIRPAAGKDPADRAHSKRLADADAAHKAALSLEKPGPGRRAVLHDRVKSDVRADLDNGKLTMQTFAAMKLKQVAADYRCGIDTARDVKNEILAEAN